ncbi:MAG: YggT family protein [Candidatus Moraniibacteriota bacterium]|nr:MAG: YggT family protein [Candidatus Moranbacteria bacterium]
MSLPGIVKSFLMLLLGAIEFFLGMHFILRLFGANPEASFVRFVSETSAPLLAPFADVFRSGHVVGFVFDFSTLLALFVYVFIGYLLIELMQYLDRSR